MDDPIENRAPRIDQVGTLLVCLVLLGGCFDYGKPFPGDGETDTGSDLETDSATDVEADTVTDPDMDQESDAETDPDMDDTAGDLDAETDPDTPLDPEVEADTALDPGVEDTSLDTETDAPPLDPVFVTILPGTFTMGSPTGESGRDTDEFRYTVTLTRPFEMMDTEVTQGQFESLMSYNPSTDTACGTGCPVETVSWHEAAAYTNVLSGNAGLEPCYACTGSGSGVTCDLDPRWANPYYCPGYRLPTEAEWEYAARANILDGTYNGTSSATDCTSPNPVLDSIAWFCGNTTSLQEVRTRDPNPWDLYDMLGNVWEWCHDWYDTYAGNVKDPWGPETATDRAIRGGAWSSIAGYTRAASRGYNVMTSTDDSTGFRVVRTLSYTDGFVTITPGTFSMGAPDTEPGWETDEELHVVTLTRPFEIMRTEVTQLEFMTAMLYNPSGYADCGLDCPVEEVNWYEAAAYANALSTGAGLETCYECSGSGASVTCELDPRWANPYYCPGYRLPTEAEWEYAARAGTGEGTYNGTSTGSGCTASDPVLDPIAWYCVNSEVIYAGCYDMSGVGGHPCVGPHPAGGRDANGWGLHDMLGNVWEWCHDGFDDYAVNETDPWGVETSSYRVHRGGSWYDTSAFQRAASRDPRDPASRSGSRGFRLARSLPYTGGFTTVTPGTFTMGSPTDEPGRDPDETEHEVTLTRTFEIMWTEVTQAQFDTLMGYSPSTFVACGMTCPVETVNWHEAAAYANALSRSEGLLECYTCGGSGASVTCGPSLDWTTPYDCPGYRLPTEAEWEYAARAGTTDGTYNGTSTLTGCEIPNTVLDPIAWFCGNSTVSYGGCEDLSGIGGVSCAGTHRVGDKDANGWGLHDMLGNVWEWCHDHSGTYPGDVTDPWGPAGPADRVLRGGSWYFYSRLARAALRYALNDIDRDHNIGFRLVRTIYD